MFSDGTHIGRFSVLSHKSCRSSICLGQDKYKSDEHLFKNSCVCCLPTTHRPRQFRSVNFFYCANFHHFTTFDLFVFRYKSLSHAQFLEARHLIIMSLSTFMGTIKSHKFKEKKILILTSSGGNNSVQYLGQILAKIPRSK